MFHDYPNLSWLTHWRRIIPNLTVRYAMELDLELTSRGVELSLSEAKDIFLMLFLEDWRTLSACRVTIRGFPCPATQSGWEAPSLSLVKFTATCPFGFLSSRLPEGAFGFRSQRLSELFGADSSFVSSTDTVPRLAVAAGWTGGEVAMSDVDVFATGLSAERLESSSSDSSTWSLLLLSFRSQ